MAIVFAFRGNSIIIVSFLHNASYFHYRRVSRDLKATESLCLCVYMGKYYFRSKYSQEQSKFDTLYLGLFLYINMFATSSVIVTFEILKFALAGYSKWRYTFFNFSLTYLYIPLLATNTDKLYLMKIQLFIPNYP